MVIEARFASNPIVPLRTFRRRSLTLANIQLTMVGAVVFGCYFFVSSISKTSSNTRRCELDWPSWQWG